MLRDIVIDTNVFLHAHDSRLTCSGDANRVLTILRQSTTYLCIDEGFDTNPARNASLIGGEYLEHFHHGSVPFAIITELAGAQRLLPVSKKVHPSIGRKINQILRDPRDRTFLKVSINSVNRFFCCHDFIDFSPAKRSSIKRDFDVNIKTEAETLPSMLPPDGDI